MRALAGAIGPDGLRRENSKHKRRLVNVPESHLPNTLGINRDELRELRRAHLIEGTDWFLDGKNITYRPSGLQKIREALKLPPEEKNAPAPSEEHPQPLPEPETLLVWNPRLVNTRILLAYKPDTDPHDPKNLLRVRVRSSENFVRSVNGKPMELKARHIQADLYELATPCPRWKGRW